MGSTSKASAGGLDQEISQSCHESLPLPDKRDFLSSLLQDSMVTPLVGQQSCLGGPLERKKQQRR